jgi:putative transposase
MVRYRRNLVPGGTYFFTVTLVDRHSSALVDHIGALRAAFRAARRERPFDIDAIVILPEHLHAVLTLPAGDADFSGRWRRIKGHFSSYMIAAGASARRHPKGEFGLWQRRFWEHTIRDEGDFARHMDYIHFNPVRHGLVSRVREWPYSSFHRYVREGLLPVDWAGDVREIGTRFGEPGE